MAVLYRLACRCSVFAGFRYYIFYDNASDNSCTNSLGFPVE